MNKDCMFIQTPAGELRCYINGDPNFPGFNIALVPKNTDYEIDIMMVEVPSDKEYLEDNNITLGDVMTYTWGDPNNEDYTHKTIISNSEIKSSIANNDIGPKYYEIHVKVYGNANGGYSKFVEAFNKNEAVFTFETNALYEEIEDIQHIDYINQISLKEYLDATSK